MKSKTLFCLVALTLFTSLIPAMHAQTFSVLHTFTGGRDGQMPGAGVTIQGNALYGTTIGVYAIGGSVYQLTNNGSNWLFSTLTTLGHNANPYDRVVFGPDGHLYGASQLGGAYGLGTVFKLTPQVGPCRDVACNWMVNDLHDFGSGTDGVAPEFGDLLWDQKGNIYDTTFDGGTSGVGTVYELTPSGNGYTESVLYSFLGGTDARMPSSGLVWDSNGNLFGTSEYGGAYDWGTVFELTYVVGVGWKDHVLYSFQNTVDGRIPAVGVIFDSAGNLYSTTPDGGSGGGGTIFELSPSGDTWTFKLLYSFSGQYNLFCGPGATLAMDAAGNLYGTTVCDGIYNAGNVFKLSNTQNGWEYTSLYDFTGGSDGAYPLSNVSIDTDGTLYGTTQEGGNMNGCNGYGCGVVWMIKP